jgi:hypothetical protein
MGPCLKTYAKAKLFRGNAQPQRAAGRERQDDLVMIAAIYARKSIE